MTIREVLAIVEVEMREKKSPTHTDSRNRILELFKENKISEALYEPWMCNNVLPTIVLK